MIEMKDVSLWRGQEFLLKNINWRVKEGEHWAILGLNGSGKTTLLNLINGYLFPSNGEITVLKHRFGSFDLRELRKNIGWVSSAIQERLYFTESAIDIVVSGEYAVIGLVNDPTEEERFRAMMILKQLGCSHFADRPYQTLSQGEKQKVLIARALMARPSLLVLDEPCTGLDLFAREKLLKFIEKLGRKEDSPTLLYVTHRTEEVLPVFNRTLLLKNGEIYQAGVTESVLTKKVLAGFFEKDVIVKRSDKRTWVSLPAHFADDLNENGE